MTEITRVPLLPIAKGSLSKLWIGAVVAVAAGGGLAWATSLTHQKLDEGVQVVTLHKGTGGSPAASDIALVNYRGTLPDGTMFKGASGLTELMKTKYRDAFVQTAIEKMLTSRMVRIPGSQIGQAGKPDVRGINTST